jgi:serine/threonine-protein kinase
VSGWAIAALTALAVLAVVALVAGLIVSQQPRKVTVPPLVDLTNAEAQAALLERDLVPDPQTRSGTDCEPERVLSQEQGADSRVNVNSKVAYTYCIGPGKVKVPALVNLPRENAEAQLERANLEAKVEEESSDKPAGTVLATDPPAETTVNEGSTVVLRVSKGDLILVPAVDGGDLTRQEAIAILRNAGFPQDSIRVVPQNVDKPNQDNIVLQQSPDGGTPRAPGDVIRIFVGEYEDPAPPTTTPPTPTPAPGG